MTTLTITLRKQPARHCAGIFLRKGSNNVIEVNNYPHKLENPWSQASLLVTEGEINALVQTRSGSHSASFLAVDVANPTWLARNTLIIRVKSNVWLTPCQEFRALRAQADWNWHHSFLCIYCSLPYTCIVYILFFPFSFLSMYVRGGAS